MAGCKKMLAVPGGHTESGRFGVAGRGGALLLVAEGSNRRSLAALLTMLDQVPLGHQLLGEIGHGKHLVTLRVNPDQADLIMLDNGHDPACLVKLDYQSEVGRFFQAECAKVGAGTQPVFQTLSRAGLFDGDGCLVTRDLAILRPVVEGMVSPSVSSEALLRAITDADAAWETCYFQAEDLNDRLFHRQQYVPNSGGASVVTLSPAFFSTDIWCEGEKTPLAYSPPVILLAHELIHAWHNQQGLNLRNLQPVAPTENERHQWSTLEEQNTIDLGLFGFSENRFRQQLGLKPRRFHTVVNPPLHRPAGPL